jgi:hypothetical protein
VLGCTTGASGKPVMAKFRGPNGETWSDQPESALLSTLAEQGQSRRSSRTDLRHGLLLASDRRSRQLSRLK